MTRDHFTGRYFAIAFDCADTLLQLDPPRAVLFRDAAADVGVALSLNDVERAYDIVDFAIQMKSSEIRTEGAKLDFYHLVNSALCDILGIRQSFSTLHPRLLIEFNRRKRWRAFPDVIEPLRSLAKRVSLYVLANWDTSLGTVLLNAGLGGIFQNTLSSATLGSEKPSRACFEAFLIHTSLNASTTLYVGNEYVADIAGARAAGLTPILVDRCGKMPAADCIRISTMAQLVETVGEYLPKATPLPNLRRKS